MDPINYGAGFQNPINTFNAAVQGGTAILDSQIKRDTLDATIAQRAAQAAAADAARQAAAERQAQNDAILQRLQQPGATFDDYMKASMLLPKDQAEAIQKAAVSMKEEERKAALIDSAEIFSAFRSSRPDIAVALLRKQGEAERATGNTKGADYAETLAQMVEKSPEGAKAVENLVGYHIAAMPGGKDAFDAFDKKETEGRKALDYPVAAEKARAEMASAKTKAEKDEILLRYTAGREVAEINKIYSEIAKLDAETYLLGLEKDRIPGTKIDESARKIMNDSATAAMKSDLVAAQSDNLARALTASPPPKGWTGTALAWFKKSVGGQDRFTALTQEYTKLRNTEALRNLPPGPASDRDIEIALKSFPDDNSNPELIASFLRGMAKLQQYNSDIEKAKVQWVNKNGSLGPAQGDFDAAGQAVKKGTNFWDFTKKIPIPNVVGSGPAPVKVEY